jgi:acyl-CoA synthetase (NDP forming)
MTLVEALFRPRAVALIGASGDPAKNTARPQRYLRKHGYSGRIVPINPGRREVLGETAYPTLADAPVDVDHAFIMVEDVEGALEDCGRRGVAVASIYSDGFADAGPAGAQRQRKLVERARALGVRLLGPNSMGVVDIPGGLALTVNAILEMESLPAGAAGSASPSWCRWATSAISASASWWSSLQTMATRG